MKKECVLIYECEKCPAKVASKFCIAERMERISVNVCLERVYIAKVTRSHKMVVSIFHQKLKDILSLILNPFTPNIVGISGC